MARLIKRYGSRKLYDTGASEYVSLDRVAAFVRDGEDVSIVDNKTGEDVTVVILSQVIAEEGRSGGALSSSFLHDLVRMGERVIKTGAQTINRAEETVGAVVGGARKNVGAVVDDARRRITSGAPLGDVRGEMDRLRARLDALEGSLSSLEDNDPAPPADAG